MKLEWTEPAVLDWRVFGLYNKGLSLLRGAFCCSIIEAVETLPNQPRMEGSFPKPKTTPS